MGGRGFFPRLSGEVLAGQSRPGLDWEISSTVELSRRSLYAYVRRTMSVPMLDAFDYSNTTSPLSERPVTTVAPQALLLLNDDFMREQAVALADRLEKDSKHLLSPSLSSIYNGGEGARRSGEEVRRKNSFITRGFQLAVGREPTKRERQLAKEFIRRQEAGFGVLSNRLTFRPDVPTSLSVTYMEKLKPRHFLLGPVSGWTYQRGRWAGAYEGIRTMERDRGPFALSTAASFSNGVIEAKLFLHTACESAGLLCRASAKDNELQGYEVVLDPREQRIVLRRHAGQLTNLAEASVFVPTGRSVPLKVQFDDARLRVWLGDETKPVIDFMDAKPVLSAGQVGTRAWGAALSLDDLVIQPDGGAPVAIRDTDLATSERRAREAFCLLLLNLNEVVYVD
jgi:hypothetical protein